MIKERREEARMFSFLSQTLCCFSFHNCFAFFDIAAHHCSIFTSICMIINQITHQLPEPEKKKNQCVIKLSCAVV